MSEENVEVVRKAIAAFVQRDAEAFVECFAPNAELLLPRNLVEGGSYKGHEGVRRAITDAFETWEDIRVDVESTRTIDDQVLVLGRTINVGKGDTPAVEYESAYVAKMSAGKITYFRPYQSHREALEAAGLSESDS